MRITNKRPVNEPYALYSARRREQQRAMKRYLQYGTQLHVAKRAAGMCESYMVDGTYFNADVRRKPKALRRKKVRQVLGCVYSKLSRSHRNLLKMRAKRESILVPKRGVV